MDHGCHENTRKALVPALAAGLIFTVVTAQGSAAPAGPPAKVNAVYAQPYVTPSIH